MMPDEIRLYQHQFESIQNAAQSAAETRPAIGVTAGTGGGKTESFLLPILSQLYTTPRRAPGGIRALILYPMNALVNDQVERLESWLAGQSRVSFFHFTSETPEDKKRADAEGLPAAAAHRFRTRQQARGKEDETGKKASSGPQPDILVTNYSMLEYMLCRPQDAVFFSSALEAIVLDEAHLYSGTLAAEIMLLLRRLMLRCGVQSDQVLQVATSATLGGTKEELGDFIAKLFSKSVDRTKIIQGEVADFELQPTAANSPTPDPTRIANEAWLPSGTITVERGEQQLLVDADACQQLASQLSLLADSTVIDRALQVCDDTPALLLWNVLPSCPLIHAAANSLDECPQQKLDELAETLWGTCNEQTRKATTQLLRLAASARPRVDRLPVLPHRLHLQVRAPTSLSLCLFPACHHDESPQLSPLGSVTSKAGGKCIGCESPTYPIARCGNCGCWGVGAVLHQNKLLPASPIDLSPGPADRILIPVENVEGQKPGTLHVVDPSDGNCAVATGVRMLEVDHCPRCDEPVRDRGYRWLSTVDSLALSIATETLLAELPPMPRGRSWRPAEGRQLLTFSDSRQAAARLGPRLENQHETQMFRAMLAKQADAALQQKSRRAFLERDIQAKKTQLEEPGIGEDCTF